jgi:hypothetical protein
MPDSRIVVFPRDRVTVIRGPQGPGGAIPPAMERALLEAARRRKAEEEINRKWASLGGAAGEPTGDLTAIGDGYYRQYVNGRIYYRLGHPLFHVYGFIGEKYAQLGGPDSWLGWPTSDEQPFDQGGRVSTFQYGAIYWWPDTGAIELGSIAVRYTGLACFGETDDGTFSAHDEPYVIFGVVPIVPMEPSAPRTVIYEGVDAGDSRIDNIELYRGLPYGLMLKVILFEHDFSDPDQYRELVKNAVAAASTAVTAAVGAVPIVGPFLAIGAGALLAAVGPAITDAIKDVLDTQDDFVGEVSLVVTPKDMVTMARTQPKDFRAIQWDMDSPLISGDGGSYKVYIDIQAV